MDLYIHAPERRKNKDVAPKACNETFNSCNDRKKGNTFLCTWQTALQSITYPITAWHSLPVMVIVRTQVLTLSFQSSHSTDKCICWLPMHAYKPTRFWTPCWRALPIFSQMLHRCSVLQKTGAASSRPCRQHSHAFSAPDVCSSDGSASIQVLWFRHLTSWTRAVHLVFFKKGCLAWLCWSWMQEQLSHSMQ